MIHFLLSVTLAAAPSPPPASPLQAVRTAAFDLSRQSPADRPFCRYLYLHHAPQDLANAYVVQCLHWNLLSRAPTIKLPTLIAPNLIRLDTRDYSLPLPIWEKLARIDPYFHSKVKLLKDYEVQTVWPGGKDGDEFFKQAHYRQFKKAGSVIDDVAFWLPRKEMDYLRKQTYSESPILNAQWVFVQTTRQISIRNKQEGVGYYDFLEIKNRNDFFKLTGMDPKETVRLLKEIRAAVILSGVSQQNRIIETIHGVGGRGWYTLDTFTEQGRGVVRSNLLPGEFLHQAEEHIAPLPNGLPANFLCDDKGEAQESAPDKLGPDDSPTRIGRDARIHINLSCWRCHAAWKKDEDYLKPIDDWVRTRKRNLQDPSKKVALELERLYGRDLLRPLQRDRADFAFAVRLATTTIYTPKGLSVYDAGQLYVREWNAYVDTPVTLEIAARELGVTAVHFRAALQGVLQFKGGIEPVLGSLLDGFPVSRLEWEDRIQLANVYSLGGVPPEILEKLVIKKD